MRNKAIAVLAGVMVLSASAWVAAQQAKKAEKGLIVGDAIELSTYAIKGSGEEHVESMRNRTEQGFPVGILEDETGIIWVAVYKNSAPASGLQTANLEIADYIGKKVVVQGLKYKADGMHLIQFSTIGEY